MVTSSRLSSRAFWGLASWALPLAVMFVVSPKLLHALGAARFGVLMIALITPMIASQFDFGIVSAAVRRIAAGPSHGKVDAGRTLVPVLLVLSITGAGLGLIVWIGAEPIARWIGISQVLGTSDGPQLVRVCAAWFAVSLPALVPGIAARALQAFRLIATLQTVNTLLLWLSALALVMRGGALDSIVWLAIAYTIATSLTTVLVLRTRVDWSMRKPLDLTLVTSDWRFSAGMFASQAAGALVYQADRILVSTLGSPAIAGLYALCVSVANKTSAAVTALASFVYPHAAHLDSTDRQDSLGGLLMAVDRAVAILVVPLLVPALCLARPFLRLWVGDFATDELVDAFRLLVVAFALPTFAVPIASILAGKGQAGLAARFSWLTVLVVVAGFSLLVPPWGLVGAATAMLLGNSTALVFSVVARRSLGLSSWEGRLRLWCGIVLGAAAQLAFAYSLAGRVTGWASLVGIGAAAWAVFYAVRAIFRALSPEERAFIDRARAGLPIARSR
jgi:O-antigen/teichoic acid export membrane protein